MSLMSFICVQPVDSGDLRCIFQFLAHGPHSPVLALSADEIRRRLEDYKGTQGLITNFDSVPQIIEFRKALHALEQKHA